MKYMGTLLAAATLALAAPAHAEQGRLCVDEACLGMTLAEAEALPLAPARYAFKLGGKGDHHGLDSSGQRVNYAETGEFDAAVIRQFRSGVATVCSFGSATARLTGSDGRQLVLLFVAAMKNGKGELVLSEIGSFLPKQLSEAEVQRVKTEARARYGDAFSATWSKTITRPDVALYQNRMVGNTLTLRLPEHDVGAALMAQPGCAGE
jgi:hypothetical protein